MVFSFNIKKFFDRICFLLFFLINNNSFSQQISLAGVWRFAVDRDDVGINEMWFNKKPGDVIKLPGTMAENRKGDDVTLQIKWTGSIYEWIWLLSGIFLSRLLKNNGIAIQKLRLMN